MSRLPRCTARPLCQLLLAAALALAAVVATELLDPPVAAAQDKLDLNNADAKDLARLPGLNKVLAERIVAWRNKNGPFTDVKDLLKVNGIQKRGFGKLAARLTVDAPANDDDDDKVKTLADREEDDPEPVKAGDAGPGAPGLQRSNRMEFDGRLIKGQTAGAGAVFLFERAPRPLPSMVARRTSYLDDTVASVLGSDPVLDDDPNKPESKDAKADSKATGKDDKPTPGRRRPRR